MGNNSPHVSNKATCFLLEIPIQNNKLESSGHLSAQFVNIVLTIMKEKTEKIKVREAV